MSKKEVLESTFTELNLMLADSPKTFYRNKGKQTKTTEDLAYWFGAEIER